MSHKKEKLSNMGINSFLLNIKAVPEIYLSFKIGNSECHGIKYILEYVHCFSVTIIFVLKEKLALLC